MNFSRTAIENEIRCRTSRSSGPGGQNVNKTETRVEAIWNIMETNALNTEQKDRLLEKVKTKINSNNEIIIAASEARSQLRNKQIAKDRLIDLLESSLIQNKPRKRTSPSKNAVKKRIESKVQKGELKKMRAWKFKRDH